MLRAATISLVAAKDRNAFRVIMDWMALHKIKDRGSLRQDKDEDGRHVMGTLWSVCRVGMKCSGCSMVSHLKNKETLSHSIPI